MAWDTVDTPVRNSSRDRVEENNQSRSRGFELPISRNGLDAALGMPQRDHALLTHGEEEGCSQGRSQRKGPFRWRQRRIPDVSVCLNLAEALELPRAEFFVGLVLCAEQRRACKSAQNTLTLEHNLSAVFEHKAERDKAIAEGRLFGINYKKKGEGGHCTFVA
eukprot:245934-Rhodomonas_salina.2